MNINLHWLAWQPTPYNATLFRALANDPFINLKVYFQFPNLNIHPWQSTFQDGYQNRICNKFNIDRELVKIIILDPDAYFVFAGWPGITSKITLFIAILLHRNFLFWTDTPQYVITEKRFWKIKEVNGAGSNYSWWHQLIRSLLYYQVYKNAQAVMSTGSPGVQALLDFGCSPKKVTNLPFFVELPPLGKERKTESNNIFTFVSSGQLIHRKGYDIAIRAFAKIKKTTDYRFRYLLLGDGPERSSLNKLIKNNNLENDIILEGWKEPDEVSSILLKSDAFIHPARQDPFPVAVLEAMAAGLPVFGSDASGSVLDRVTNGQNGYIHPVNDDELLTTQILGTLENVNKLKLMKQAARIKAEEWPVSRGVETIKEILFRFGPN